LPFEIQKGERLDQKLHRSRPLFGQDKRFGNKNILFLYFVGWFAAGYEADGPLA
jgi:hypothetical protein